jgi:hypothetical protein
MSAPKLAPGKLSVLLVLATLVGCSDEGPVAEPGTLTATIAGPNGAEGAAVVLLLGDGVGTVAPAGDTEVFARAGDSQTRVVLVHPEGGALTFTVSVDDVTNPPATVVEEVAGPDDVLRGDVSAYSVEFTR